MEKTKRVSRLAASGRITPREVLEAYESTGFAPLFGNWIEEARGLACAITALTKASGKTLPPDDDGFIDAVEGYVEVRMPYVGSYYRNGFTSGFDGNPLPEPSGDDHPLVEGSEGWNRIGWRDGKRARAFVNARL